MKLYEICFSPTGGTKKVSRLLSETLSDNVISVDLTDPALKFSDVCLERDDAAIIAVPSYGGRVPQTAIQRLSDIHGGNARAILVCVYGNRDYEDTLAELEDTAAAAGFQTIAAVAAIAEHSIARQFAAGRPDAADTKQLKSFAGRIRSKLEQGGRTTPAIPGNRPYKKGGGSGMVPMPGDDCVRCGLCARQCPTGAIDLADPGKVDAGRCISCMRCIALCPHAARHLEPGMLAAVREMLQKVCIQRRDCELFI